jgi:hypothetical protein
MSGRQGVLTDNGRPRPGDGLLAVCAPFYLDDPFVMIEAVGALPEASRVELAVLDDGTCNPELTRRVEAAMARYPGPARLVTCASNAGRAASRNDLVALVDTRYLLFVDADVTPGAADFLARYLTVAANGRVDACYGGLITRGPVRPDRALALNVVSQIDGRSAAERERRGFLAIASNNLMIRGSLAKQIPFGNDFEGWGWEDTDWGAKALAAGAHFHHIDNPAINTGLDTPETLLRKYREAAWNLKRFLRNHPHLADELSGVKVARHLGRVPGQAMLRPVFAFAARDPLGFLPMTLRRIGLKLWRASWAAEALA